MIHATENRIWRGLFLVAIVGVGIAAGTADRRSSIVSGWSGPDGAIYAVSEGGRLYQYGEQDLDDGSKIAAFFSKSVFPLMDIPWEPGSE